jgi:pimeloyl-ACP methyl ester carboxylesterase
MTSTAPLRHSKIDVEDVSLNMVEGGTVGSPTVMFLHGWPESWAAFERVMLRLSTECHVIAIDLPGIGESTCQPQANDKAALAEYVGALINKTGLRDVVLVGHDIGGQIVYSFLHRYPNSIRKAVIMNVTVPGVAPWSEVERNPRIWHYAFHAVPNLPEMLVSGHQDVYFDFFYDAIAASPSAVPHEIRKIYRSAYSTPQALHVGFEWYRAFVQDERDNVGRGSHLVDTPVLYIRGDHESDMQPYLDGFRKSGLRNVQGRVIRNCGHFAPDEQPDQVAEALHDFIGQR